MKKKILIIEKIHAAGLELLNKNEDFQFEIITNTDPDYLKTKIFDCDGISIRTSLLTNDVIEKAKNLKIISRHGVGYDNIDLKSVKKNKITLAITASSVLSLTGVSGTSATGEEQVYSLIEPTQVANWVEKAA